MKNTDSMKYSCVEVKPGATSATVPNLVEKREYMITVTAICDEFFEQLPEGKSGFLHVNSFVLIKRVSPCFISLIQPLYFSNILCMIRMQHQFAKKVHVLGENSSSSASLGSSSLRSHYLI